MNRYGRDPRRRLTLQERRWLYERARGLCQRCGTALGPEYHNAHLAAWTNGGATNVEQMEAWCATCNLRLGPQDVVEKVQEIELRPWQSRALPRIVHQLYQTGVATLHAAPGAGKTYFAGATFRQLLDAGHVDRLVVVVPNRALLRQWVQSLGWMRIHLDSEPRDGYLEHPDTVGTVVTYQSLPGAAAAHTTRMSHLRTLVVLDEVHHVAEKASWGNAVRKMVGDAGAGNVEHAAGVLNMTGTLFRSNNALRISTVRYNRVATADGEKLQAVADWSEPTANLIGRELRAPDLHVYGARVEMVDIRDEAIVTADIADLDRQQRATVLRHASTKKSWIHGFATEAVKMLKLQQLAIGDDIPLKLLYVANDINAAKRAADAINEVTQQDFARLVTSEEPKALHTLRAAAKEQRSLAIVSVRMVTEGFDCPEISTIAYATNIIAELFIAQTMARAMRITDLERAQGAMLPAKILIPDDPAMRRAFSGALASALHTVEEPPDGPQTPGPGGGDRLPRYQLLDLSNPLLRSANVLVQEDGEVLADELAKYVTQCREVGIPETYAPRVAVVSRRGRPPIRIYSTGDDNGPGATAADDHVGKATGNATATIAADPRSLNKAYRRRLSAAVGWMQQHIDHDNRYDYIGIFQNHVNRAAGIPRGERDAASTDQLRSASDWVIARIAEHCQTHGEPMPSWAEEDA